MGLGGLAVGVSLFVFVASIFSSNPVALVLGIILLTVVVIWVLIKHARDDSAKGQRKEEVKSLGHRSKPGPKNIFYTFRKSTWESPSDRSNRQFMNDDMDLNDGHISHHH